MAFNMEPFDQETILHVLSRCEACQLGQVGTRVCVEKGHLATVASVKRSARGSNFVDPYTEEEVDARYRLMLKPGEPLNIIRTNAVIDGAVKFAPGTIFQQPPNAKSQTLLGCFKSGVPLHDFILGGANAAAAATAAATAAAAAAAAALKREKEAEGEVSERQLKRKAPSSTASTPTKKGPVAPIITAKKPMLSFSEKAAASGSSGITSQHFSRAELEDLDGEGEAAASAAAAASSARPGSSKRQGTRSSSGAGTPSGNGTKGGAEEGLGFGPEGADSATQLEFLSSAEAELRRSFDAHMAFLTEAEDAKKAEMAAFQRAGEATLKNLEQSRQATKEDGLKQHKAFLNQRQRITRLRMEEVDQERARNQLESEKREARLKAEKEALSRACEQEAAELGNAWAVVEAAAGFVPGASGTTAGEEGASTGGDQKSNGEKMELLAAAAVAENGGTGADNGAAGDEGGDGGVGNGVGGR